MLTISQYIMENSVLPFSNSDFAQNGYEPLNGGDFQGMLAEWINFNHGDLQVRPTVENAMEKDVTTIQKMVVNLYKVKKYTYERLYNSTLLKYEPIENYDRIESWEDTGGGTFQKGKVDSEETFNKGDITTNFGKVTDSTHKVAAFNSTDPEVANTDNTTDSGSDSQTFGADSSHGSVTNGLDESTTKGTHEGRIHGNIGVTTSQRMMQAEIDLTTAYNFLDRVCELYANRLLIGVW